MTAELLEGTDSALHADDAETEQDDSQWVSMMRATLGVDDLVCEN